MQLDRVVYMAVDQKAQEAMENADLFQKLFRMSCLELPNKGSGRKKLLLGSVVEKMKVGW